jgi:hypothetical protein
MSRLESLFRLVRIDLPRMTGSIHGLVRLSSDLRRFRALTKHIFAVETLTRANTSWEKFYRSMQRALPKRNENLELNLTDKQGAPL